MCHVAVTFRSARRGSKNFSALRSRARILSTNRESTLEMYRTIFKLQTLSISKNSALLRFRFFFFNFFFYTKRFFSQTMNKSFKYRRLADNEFVETGIFHFKRNYYYNFIDIVILLRKIFPEKYFLSSRRFVSATRR